MELIQPIFVNQSGSTREAGLGVENKNYSQTDLFERIQKDIDLGVDSFLLFTTPDTKTWLPTWDWQSEIVNKIKKAKTDPLPMPHDVKELDERLEARNLLGIYSSLTNSTLENSVKNFAGKNFSEFKEQLSEELVKKIEPISNEIKKLLEDKKFLDEILLDGVEKANMIASKKIERIKEIVGF